MFSQLDIKNVELLRVLSEVRYSRSFLFDDLKQINQLSKGLKQFFTQVQKDEQNNALVLIQPENHRIAVIAAETTSVEMVNPTYVEFETLTKVVMGQLSESLDIDEFNRMGTRFFFGKPIGSLEEGQELLSAKFFQKFNDEIGHKLVNPSLVFTFKKNESYFVNVNLRAETNVEFEVSDNIVNHKQDSFIIIDIDVYSTSMGEYDAFVHESKIIGLETLKQILGLLEG